MVSLLYLDDISVLGQFLVKRPQELQHLSGFEIK